MSDRQGDAPWEAYVSSVIEVTWRDGTVYRVGHAAGDVTEGPFPDGVRIVDVITGSNPRSARLSEDENAGRNEQLAADLDAAGLEHLPAVGRAPNDREPWEEASFAVIDAELEEVLSLARAYDQAAIFRWTRDDRRVIPCAPDDPALDDPTLTHGWRSTRDG